MSKVTKNVVAATPAINTEKPKYLVQREKRQRYSFGNTWLNAVLAGVVTDQDKLIAHGIKVNAGTPSALAALSFDTLLKRVQDAIYAEQSEAEPEVEAPAETETETEAPAETEVEVEAPAETVADEVAA